MTTTKEVITDALEDILAIAEEEPIESDTAQTAIRYLNDMMTMWDAQGISLGYTIVSNLADVLTVAPGAIMGIKANLSVALVDKFKGTLTQGTITRAKEGWKAIQNLASLGANSMAFPSTLPIGSGNEDEQSDWHFYPELENTILTETGGSIALESDTEEE